MKNTICTLFVILGLTTISTAQLANQQQNQQRKIQVAILFDTSGSMNGLLSQAKSRIWNIVNTLTTFKYDGQTPDFEFALYDYGNSTISSKVNYVRCISPFTTDLDDISAKLFGLTTNGGEEYCAAVIQTALDELKWSKDSRDMKLIYIAGNEPFNQGPIDYKKSLKNAIGQDVFVNTIYCGPYDQGVRELWYEGAELGQGKYFNIDQNEKIRFIATPYDDSISALNTKLNKTYLGYGAEGKRKKEEQSKQDDNAMSIASENAVERTMSKSSAAYVNTSWDLVDYSLSNPKALKDIKDEDLPEEMRGKTLEQKEKILEEKRIERAEIQSQVARLGGKRQSYIENELKNTKGEDDFGKAVAKSLIELGEKKNYSNEK
jgi:hypothetical protein